MNLQLNTETEYSNLALSELIGRINIEYYQVVEKQLTDYGENDFVRSIESNINNFIQLRKDLVIPYIQELHEKVSTGHNCSSCSGRCHVQHTLKTTELTGSIEEMKKALDSQFPSSTLTDTINELLIIEEHILMPKIIHAQKEINVHS